MVCNLKLEVLISRKPKTTMRGDQDFKTEQQNTLEFSYQQKRRESRLRKRTAQKHHRQKKKAKFCMSEEKRLDEGTFLERLISCKYCLQIAIDV